MYREELFVVGWRVSGLDDAEAQGNSGTRYLFPPLRRITLHAPDTSQGVERFQHDSSGWINLDSTQQLKLPGMGIISP